MIFANRCNRASQWAMFVLAVGFSAGLAYAKPPATVYAEVEITFGGQTFGFSGLEDSFSQSADGGRIVFEVTQLQAPGYTPLPPVDIDALEPSGNQWVVQTNVGRRPYAFVGICASETYTTADSGFVIRHLNLNCKSFDDGTSP